ncbi:MAG: tRNA (cytidine(56)-2'-O)-methyltransferase [Thermogladius sp.]|jgi:tRNA (cytidine56-2'-O)-methyltransferase|nr:tRNA (cytidine(56)-2'-O)-methyltransferase [Thermogladius sp.]
MVEIYVLRIGHRPGRDKRVTTHVGLVARAFGANGLILGDIVDESVARSLRKISQLWGGLFDVVMGVNSVEYAKKWKHRGLVVHLTMYGLHVDDVIDEIRDSGKDLLIVVGAEKVPRIFYELADYNVAVGHQPHSEVAALAVFLDRYYKGVELHREFSGAKLTVIPTPRGKKVLRIDNRKNSDRHAKNGKACRDNNDYCRENDG